MRVRVHPHWNKVKAGEIRCVSVKQSGKPVRYRGSVLLTDVWFIINVTGQLQAKAERVRNVHAWAVGELQAENDKVMSSSLLDELTEREDVTKLKVKYHYDTGRFLDQAGNDISECRFDFGLAQGKDFYVWSIDE